MKHKITIEHNSQLFTGKAANYIEQNIKQAARDSGYQFYGIRPSVSGPVLAVQVEPILLQDSLGTGNPLITERDIEGNPAHIYILEVCLSDNPISGDFKTELLKRLQGYGYWSVGHTLSRYTFDPGLPIWAGRS